MILPIAAALERIPRSLLEASADLGARPLATFRHVVLPLALPGVVAGSIFTFSLTLGDFVVPGALGDSSLYLGQAVLAYQGTAGNIPLAAAFTAIPDGGHGRSTSRPPGGWGPSMRSDRAPTEAPWLLQARGGRR